MNPKLGQFGLEGSQLGMELPIRYHQRIGLAGNNDGDARAIF